MAKALDVSTRELDKDVEGQGKGAFPKKYCQSLLKRWRNVYGISKTVNRIDTLAAAQGRFNKAWLDFVSAMKLSGFFQDTFNEFGKMLNFLSSGSRDIIDNMRLQNEEFDKQMALVDELTAAEVASFDIRKKLIDEMLKHDFRKTRAEKAYEQYLKKRIKQEEEALAREKDVANYRAKNNRRFINS